MQEHNSPPAQISRRARFVAALVAIVLATLLTTAATLTPSKAGHGTHTQLGLGECLVFAKWGVRCPTCGMTTSWSHLMHGQLRQSAGASAGGLLLGLSALLAVPWLLASAVRGRWCYLRPTAGLLFPFFAVLVLVLLIDWLRHTGLSLLREFLFT